jgi:hypothetical protein
MHRWYGTILVLYHTILSRSASMMQSIEFNGHVRISAMQNLELQINKKFHVDSISSVIVVGTTVKKLCSTRTSSYAESQSIDFNAAALVNF